MHDMPRKLPPNVRAERTRHGKIVFYHRIGLGKRTRLHGVPGTDEFKASARLAETGQAPAPKTKSGSFGWLVEKYAAPSMPDLLGIKPSTHAAYTATLRAIVAQNPARKANAITRANVQAGMAKRTPNAANNMLRALNSLFGWAVSMELMPTNPCDGIRKRRPPKTNVHTWTQDQIDHARSQWPSGSKWRLALEIGAMGGLAAADAVKLGPRHIQPSGEMIIARTKTGVQQQFTPPPSLANEIALAPLAFTYLQKNRGNPLSPKAFASAFSRACDDIGLPPECTYHGLRRYRATSLAEMQFTVWQIMTWLGWDSISEAELYTRKADRNAISGRSAEQYKNGPVPHLPTGAASSAKNIRKSNG